jgi:NhaP-type Na+/H+ or K+/H+ antiporter
MIFSLYDSSGSLGVGGFFSLSAISANLSNIVSLELGLPELNTITIIGFIIIFSFLGSRLFKRIGVPQIVGFISAGLVLGPSFLNLVPATLSKELVFISQIALGLIGFDIGSHLKAEELKEMGRSIVSILFSESFSTFTFVSIGLYVFTRDHNMALLFGAIATATAHAATVDVIAEYDAKGPLTTSLLAVIGLDDALALIMFYLSAGIVESNLKNAGSISLFELLAFPVYEIFGSIVLGVLLSLVLDMLLSRVTREHDAMALSLGFILFTVGMSLMLHLSLILSTMAMGLVLVNRRPEHGYKIRYTIEQAGPVVYVLFFTLIGAKFDIAVLPYIGVMGILYIVLRSLGKYFGASFGGNLGGADPLVCRNIGLGLLTQAGVAAGLALEAYNRFIFLGP